MSENKTILKSASTISLFIVISRITGFLRDVLIAGVFGTGVAAQAFFVAFKIPNMIRDVIGEGAANAAFVPVFSEYLAKRTRSDFLKLVNTLLGLLLGVSFIIMFAGIFLAPLIVTLIAPGFIKDTLQFGLTVNLTRFLFPYLILITFSAYLMAVSNSLKSFAVPAASSIVFNIVLIIAVLLIKKDIAGSSIYILALAVLAAGLMQALIQVPPLIKNGVNFRKGGRYEKPFSEPVIRRVGRLILPRILGTSVYQFNVFIDTIFASLAFFVGDGAIAAIYYANRIIQFPFSIFGVALSVASLPHMSVSSANNDFTELKKTLVFCIKSVFIGVIPLTAGIIIFSSPLVTAVFQRGNFSGYSSQITSTAVFFYAFGIISYIGVRLFSHAFYALQDTVTPVKTSATALFINIVFNSLFIFVFNWGIAGLALASSISATCNVVLLYIILSKRVGFFLDRFAVVILLKVLVSSCVMGVIVFYFWRGVLCGDSTLLNMFFVACLGAVIYFSMLWIFKIREIKELLFWFQKKR